MLFVAIIIALAFIVHALLGWWGVFGLIVLLALFSD